MITIRIILQPRALGLRVSPTCPVSKNQRQGSEPPVTLQGLYVAHVLPELSRHSELRAFQLGIILSVPFPGDLIHSQGFRCHLPQGLANCHLQANTLEWHLFF